MLMDLVQRQWVRIQNQKWTEGHQNILRWSNLSPCATDVKFSSEMCFVCNVGPVFHLLETNPWKCDFICLFPSLKGSNICFSAYETQRTFPVSAVKNNNTNNLNHSLGVGATLWTERLGHVGVVLLLESREYWEDMLVNHTRLKCCSSPSIDLSTEMPDGSGVKLHDSF